MPLELTAAGSVMGTVSHMSPEQIRGEPLDSRTDLFSFGIVLYEMATGALPFSGPRPSVVFACILNREPVPPLTLNPSLPPELQRIIHKCLAKDRTRRYQHAGEIGRDLDALTRRSKPAPKSLRFAIPIVALAAALAVGIYAHFHSALNPTAKLALVLADFANTTGDAAFDQTLRQGLSVELAQLPSITLVSEVRIHQLLQLMLRPADARVTPEVAREICERDGAAAVIEGSIASLGSQYVVGLRARNCQTGDVLEEQQTTVQPREPIVPAFTRTAAAFRARLTDKLAAIEPPGPLEDVTTPSLEALKAFTMAYRLASSTSQLDAAEHFLRAIALDPQFAMAYCQLAMGSYNNGQTDLAGEYAGKAYQLRERASEHEKFFITYSYDRHVTGNLERAARTLELWQQAYPRDVDAHSLMAGRVTLCTGKYEKSIQESEAAIAIDPGNGHSYGSLAAANIYLGRLAQGEEVLRQAANRKIDQLDLPVFGYYLAFFRNDERAMARQAAVARNRRDAEDQIAHHQAMVLAYAGRLREAVPLWQHAIDLASRTKDSGRAALYQAAEALAEARAGRSGEARRDAQDALDRSKDRDNDYFAAVALALCGESTRARDLAGQLAQRFPEDSLVQHNYLPTLRAFVALNAGNPQKALAALEAVRPYDLAQPGTSLMVFFGALYQVDARGRAYLAANRPLQAAAEFQRIIDNRGVAMADSVTSLAYLQLARALKQAGDGPKAKAAYRQFLDIWKQADTDLPILKTAQAEFATLP